MEVKINTKDSVTTAQLIGRLDTPASQEISGDFDNLMQYAAGTVILDCTELEYISSSGLRLFLSLRKAAASKGGNVIVKAINKDIRSVFMMTGFLNLLRSRTKTTFLLRQKDLSHTAQVFFSSPLRQVP